MSSAASTRTPISILQEVCVKKGITPVYELISSDGPIHEPNYVFLCSAGPFRATSKGSSKKKAKHQASYLILLQMLASSTIPECDKAMLRDLHFTAANFLSSDFLDCLEANEPELAAYRIHREDETNYVGQLQELCQENAWPPPVYEFVTLSQPIREYHCQVKLWKWSSEGSGSSKKSAKRSAAGSLLNLIVTQNLTIPPEALESMEEEALSLLTKDAKLDSQISKTETEAKARVTVKCLRWLCDASGNRINLPVEPPPDPLEDACIALNELAVSCKITVLYTYESNTKSGLIHCLIHLSTTPPHVIKGVAADNLDAARQNAAFRAILFLKSMCSATPKMDYDRWFETTLLGSTR